MIKDKLLAELAKYLALANAALFSVLVGFIAATGPTNPSLALTAIAPLYLSGVGFAFSIIVFFYSNVRPKLAAAQKKATKIVDMISGALAAMCLLFAGDNFISNVTKHLELAASTEIYSKNNDGATSTLK